MLSTALIVFREILEAALLIGILAAATRDVAHRGRYLAAGVLLGLLGACLVALFAGHIAGMASGVGQELFNAGVLGLAVLMLGWHNIWMTRHGRQMAQQARSLGDDIQQGQQSLSVLLLVVGLAVLREGSEVVLFLYGIAAGGSTDAGSMLWGGALGTVTGIGLGWALYLGLLRIPLRWFFGVTSALILLLAAGMASQAARFLIQADLLPDWGSPLWDSSDWLPQDSMLGTLLHTLAGYDAQPSGMQLVFYTLTLVLIGGGMRLTSQTRTRRCC